MSRVHDPEGKAVTDFEGRNADLGQGGGVPAAPGAEGGGAGASSAEVPPEGGMAPESGLNSTAPSRHTDATISLRELPEGFNLNPTPIRPVVSFAPAPLWGPYTVKAFRPRPSRIQQRRAWHRRFLLIAVLAAAGAAWWAIRL